MDLREDALRNNENENGEVVKETKKVKALAVAFMDHSQGYFLQIPRRASHLNHA